MNRVKIKAYAKINLTLEIVGCEGGYHLLDSLVASVDIYDVIVLKKRKDGLSSVRMHGQGSESIPPEKNNALKAAEAFSKKFGVNGVDVTVYKNIPIGAGLGGSSADVSGVLSGMARLYKIDDKAGVEALAETLGSDVKYMLDGGFVRMQGRGERLTKTKITERLNLLLLCPKSSVNTGACYQKYDDLNIPFTTGENTTNCLSALEQNNQAEGGRYLTNALFAAATALNTDVQKAHDALLELSPLGVAMTGSGSAVFAVFETQELCEWAKSRYKGKARAYVTRTIVPKDEEKRVWKNPFGLSQEEKELSESEE